MKKVILGIAIILALIWVYVIYVNLAGTASFVHPYKGDFITMKTGWLLLAFGLFTCVIDCLSVIWYMMSKTDLNKNYQIKMDKLSVQSDNDKSQVRVLENKIKTLEAVVDKLTKEKNV